MYSVSMVTIAWFALAWFVVGVVAGHGLQVVTEPKRRRKSRSKKPRPQRKPQKTASRVSGDSVEIYVGNLSYGVSKRDLKQAFGEYGDVADIRIIRSKNSGKSRGYGFVEMPDRRKAEKAIKAMNGKDYKGRALVVNEAKSRSRD
jgi:RNA recognition motif-containing protein